MSNTRILKAQLTLSQVKEQDTQVMQVDIEDSGDGPCVVIATDRWVVNFEDLDALVTKLTNLREAYSTI